MKSEIICGIYCITNKINGKKYIGQSVDIFTRWKQERSGRVNKYLRSAFKKYGLHNFDFSIIKKCKFYELDSFEKYYIKKVQSNNSKYGYNLTVGGKGVVGYTRCLPKKDYFAFYDKKYQEGKMKRVYCKELNLFANSINKMFKMLRKKHKKVDVRNISACCHKKRKHCGTLTFEFCCKVFCETLGKLFNSASQALRYLLERGFTKLNLADIIESCKSEKSCEGLHFVFTDYLSGEVQKQVA